MAAQLFAASQAAVVLIKADEALIKACSGVNAADWTQAGALTQCLLAQAKGSAFFAPDLRREKALAEISAATLAGLRFCAMVPLTGSAGEILGALLVADTKAHKTPDAGQRAALRDLATLAGAELRRDAEAAASRREHVFDLERQNLAFEAAHLAAYEWDIASGTFLLSDNLRKMLGVDADYLPADVDQGLGGMVHPDDRDTIFPAVRDGLARNGRYTVEHRLVRPSDQAVLWVSSVGVMVREGEDDPGHVIGVIQDITARRIADEQRETLVAELDHRVKNVLAAVQSMAAQSARKASSLEGFLKTFTGRLKSMASAHQLLTATRWRGAGMRNLAAAELGGIAPGQTRWEGPDLILAPRAANAMSLALHELATNAVKFGALSVDAGRVDVRWRGTPDGGLELRWTEHDGPPVSTPTRRGFGATLLEKVTGRELDGEVSVEHRREGVSAVIKVGASAVALAPAIPMEAKPAEAAAPAEPQAPRQARIDGLKVLIVEDALLLALELEAGLEEAGAVIAGSAADVDEALGMVDRPIDAAVLDANLNGASVLPVAEALAARGIPFVFATGYGENRIDLNRFDAPVIRKPYDVTQVASALAEVTGRA
ncbi:MAG: HWE histidine kinase domain-containing protein [Caulobacteraceae bacterium]|nr:HWE histidine kinase domain-containing protein [Caulobacteraceae bacterium]